MLRFNAQNEIVMVLEMVLLDNRLLLEKDCFLAVTYFSLMKEMNRWL